FIHSLAAALPQAGEKARHPGPQPFPCGSHPDRGSGSSSILSAALVPQRTLPGPTRTPACMHGEETGLLRRGALGILTAAVMRLHSHQVCLITRRQTWMFQRPSSSHTPTPVGSLVKGRDYRRGEADS
ncbi:hypothetical protein M9458_021716, partial [Cirrhinus mrigala]